MVAPVLKNKLNDIGFNQDMKSTRKQVDSLSEYLDSVAKDNPLN